MDVSGEIVWHGCIFMPYQDLSGVMSIWAEKCDTFALVQHPADGKTKRVHCHILLGNPHVEKDSLQKVMKRRGINPGKNDHWIVDKVIRGEFKGQKYTVPDLLKYMLKGKLRLETSKNISPAQVEEAISSWVELNLSTSTTSTKSSKKEASTHYDVIQNIKAKALKEHSEWFDYQLTIDTACFGYEFEKVTIKDHHRLFYFMCSELNKARIRTSNNELERFYVTLIRQFANGTETLFSAISRKLNLG